MKTVHRQNQCELQLTTQVQWSCQNQKEFHWPHNYTGVDIWTVNASIKEEIPPNEMRLKVTFFDIVGFVLHHVHI